MLSEELPESVAAATFEFIQETLAASPRRVGKPLAAPLDGIWSARRGTYHVLYRIRETDRTVIVVDISHRRDTYRRRT